MKIKCYLISLICLAYFMVPVHSFEFTLRDGSVIKGDFLNPTVPIRTVSGRVLTIESRQLYSVEPASNSLYINTEGRYSLIVPEGWKLSEDAVHGKKLIHLKGPKETGGKITVMTQKFEENRTFYEYVRKSLEDIKKNDFILKNRESFLADGFDEALRFDLEITVSSKTLLTHQVSLYRNLHKTNLLITCVYHPEKKSMIQKVFSAFLKNLKNLD